MEYRHETMHVCICAGYSLGQILGGAESSLCDLIIRQDKKRLKIYWYIIVIISFYSLLVHGPIFFSLYGSSLFIIWFNFY